MVDGRLFYTVKCNDVIISGEAGGHPVPDQNIQTTPETDSITQGLASLEHRLSVELKVFMSVS